MAMWCKKCDNDISECTCDDLYDRIRTGADIEPNVFKRCKKCGRNHTVCDCESPEYEMVGPAGTWPAAEKVVLKVISGSDMAEYLDAMRVAFGAKLDEDAREELNGLMGEIFSSQLDEDGYIDLMRMAFMLSNGLSFVMKEMMGGGEAEGEEMTAACSASVH